MSFDNRHYLPCVRWKMGEYQAISRLSDMAMGSITPLIEVPEIGFDFENRTKSKSVDEHLAKTAKRIKDKWCGRPCFIDMQLLDPSERMTDGRHPVRHVFDDLRSRECFAIPVTGINRDADYQQAVNQVVSQDKRGLCLRISIEEAAGNNLKTAVDGALETGDLKARECDLVLDLRAPNFKPVEGFVKLVAGIIGRIPYLQQWRSFTLIGTSFPSSMAEVKKGESTLPRYEWILYKMLVSSLAEADVRPPTFGDYGISHPDVLLLDMRLVKPSATIRYTIDNAWLIIKGLNVRDYKFDQYKQHCQTIVDSTFYSGEGFSQGDEYIANCARGTEKTGNLSVWRWVGTNHHIERVVRDISSFYDSSGTP